MTAWRRRQQQKRSKLDGGGIIFLNSTTNGYSPTGIDDRCFPVYMPTLHI